MSVVLDNWTVFFGTTWQFRMKHVAIGLLSLSTIILSTSVVSSAPVLRKDKLPSTGIESGHTEIAGLGIAGANSLLDTNTTSFVDIGAGLTGVRRSSVAWGDYDNDADLDILLTGSVDFGAGNSWVFRNDDGVFVDIAAGLAGVAFGSASWGDYDNDGDLDILLTGHGNAIVYRNDGGTFTDIGAGLSGVGGSSVAWGDYDNDGDLDILLTGYSDDQDALVYVNNNGIFTDAGANLTGIELGSVAWGDYDNDGDLDILLAGSSGIGGFVGFSEIYRNDDGLFTGINAGLTGVLLASIAWGDYDNDGDLDILLTGDSNGFPTRVSLIYRNDNGLFTDIGAGLTAVERGSAAWGDYDNDGDLDIILTGQNSSFDLVSLVYRNNDGIFANIGAGLTGVDESSVAWGDYDNDGDLDFVLSGDAGGLSTVTKIYRNDTIQTGALNTHDGAWLSPAKNTTAQSELVEGTEFIVNTYTASLQGESSIASFADGSFAITWHSYLQDGSLHGIYGQRYNFDGTTSGGEFQINTATSGDQSYPSATSLADSGFVVTWASDGQGGIYGQKYNTDGTVNGGEFQIGSNIGFGEARPSVTSLMDGFVVTWDSNGQDGSGGGVYGQRYNVDGSVNGGEFQVNSYTSGDQRDSFVTSLPDGGFVAVWNSYLQDGSGNGVYGQHYNADGSVNDGEFQINSYTIGTQSVSSIISLADGGFVVAWNSYLQDGNGFGSYGQLYNADGSVDGGEFQINTYVNDNQFGVNIASLSDGGFVAIWVSDGQDGSGGGVYGQKYFADGTTNGGEFQVSDTTFDGQNQPTVESLSYGDFVVSWTSKGQDGSDDGVVAKMYVGAAPAANTPPTPPTNLASNITGTTASFSWDAATDAETPSPGLTYNIRIGSSPGAGDVFSGMSDPITGYRKIPAIGNVNHNLSWSIELPGTGDYYWTVQAIDSAFEGGAFASEQSVSADYFTDIEAGLPGVTHASLAWGDYDADGDQDLLLTGFLNPAIVSRVYRNDNGSFVNIGAGLTGVKQSSVDWGDYDNDGDLDIALTGDDNVNGVSCVYRNDGGSFVNIDAGLTPLVTGSIDWGDYDNDGDLDILLTGSGASTGIAVSKLYENNAGIFTDVNAGLIGVWDSHADWGDYDNDGDLDILLTGHGGSSGVSRIYRNDGGAFTDINASLTGVSGSSAQWGDYDNDGDLDIALIGLATGGTNISLIYRNDQGVFTDINAGLIGVFGGSVGWGDFDNDGDLDLLLSGSNFPSLLSYIYRNDDGTFVNIDAGLVGLWASAVAWADFDNDNDLDAIVAGGSNPGNTTIIYRNNSAAQNTSPSTPSNLDMVFEGGVATFSWDAATDVDTPSTGLTYNIRVGTTPGAGDIFSGMSDPATGYRKTPAMGNTNHNLTWSLDLSEIGATPFHWSVQAIDTGFQGSVFASSQLVSAVDDTPQIPASYALNTSVPNPFNPQTSISFDLPMPSQVSLKVYTVSGRHVKTLISNGSYVPGRHTVIWNGQDDSGRTMASGVYFYRLIAGEFQAINRMTLLK